jgi:glycosyltransferase involved in cell wall biosynthesis
MQILFLSHYFPPEVNAPASRTYEHCKQWVKDGYQVTVVTCAPNHPRGKVYSGYKNSLYTAEEVDGIRVIRLWTYVTANEGFLKRTLNYVSYMIAVILAAPFIRSADVVISTSPQFFNGLAGYFVSRIKRARWILEIRDLWPESILAVGAIRNKAIIRFLEYLEIFAYRKADRIVPVTDAFRLYMIGKGIDPGKIEVIKNGVDLGFYQVRSKDAGLLHELSIEGKFVASYFGTHGMAHHLETVLEAAELLSNRDDIVFLLVGEGAERMRLQGMLATMKLTNVIMLGQHAKDRMPDLWSISDASLVLLKKSDLFKTVIPSKIFESMAMQKPVILGVEGESQELLAAANTGLVIQPENSRELASAVRKLADNQELCRFMGNNGRDYVARNFDRKILARRYSTLISSLAKGNGSLSGDVS